MKAEESIAAKLARSGPSAASSRNTMGNYVGTQAPAVRRLLMISMLIGGVSCTCERVRPIASLDWDPQLDQPIRQLEEILAATAQQQPMNYTSANLAFVLDAKLYLFFERYVAAIRDKERPAAIDEQRRWLKQRKHATHEAYTEYEGGTLASFVGNRSFIEATKERLVQLERRLDCAVAPAAVR